MRHAMSDYEKQQLEQIHAWKQPDTSLWKRATNAVGAPFSWAGDQVMKIPGAEWVIEKSVGGLVQSLNDAAQWSVRPETIYAEYRGDDRDVRSAEDVSRLDLRDVDDTIGFLAAKYKTIAMGEGMGAGLAGLPGIPVDVVALVSMNLRAVGEYAVYCGFDMKHQHERAFALQVMGLASSPTDAAKQVAMANLVKIASDVAKKRTWKELERHFFVKMIQELAKALGIRLTKAKLAQLVPVAGAVVGGGFNAYYTGKVCEAAFHLYRERFLAEKYGAEAVYGR